MSLSGRLETMDLPEVLQWVTIGRKTGSLSFVRDKTKVYLFLQDGKIISSRSNDPTKQLGQFLLFQGKTTEPELKRAFEIHLQSRVMLGKILVQENMVSQEDVAQALITRTEEVIYDLFLWEDGHFHFSSNAYNLDELVLIQMDINALLFEGIRRKDEWKRIRSVFPSNDVVLLLRSESDLKNLTLTPPQKKLLYLLTLKKPISEIILELHGSDFLVNYELFQLYEMGLIEIQEILRPPSEPESPAKLFNKGLELMQSQKYQEAIAAFQAVIRLDPQNAWASEQIEQAEKALCHEYYRTSIPASKVPFFLIPMSSLVRHNLSHEEGFVASRINGAWDVKSIVMLSPLRELEILQVIDKLLGMQIIALK
jgi:tetratricopeptide (TPR) repeat protein